MRGGCGLPEASKPCCACQDPCSCSCSQPHLHAPSPWDVHGPSGLNSFMAAGAFAVLSLAPPRASPHSFLSGESTPGGGGRTQAGDRVAGPAREASRICESADTMLVTSQQSSPFQLLPLQIPLIPKISSFLSLLAL